MRRDIRLRSDPTPRESISILGRIDDDLSERGALVKPRGIATLLVRVPRIWRLTPAAFRLGALLFISKATVTVVAGTGGPRRVRYELDFLALQIIGLLSGIATLAVGLSWRRMTLVAALLAVWLLLNIIPRYLADRAMHRLVYRSLEPIVERRQAPRDSSTENEDRLAQQPPPDVSPQDEDDFPQQPA